MRDVVLAAVTFDCELIAHILNVIYVIQFLYSVHVFFRKSSYIDDNIFCVLDLALKLFAGSGCDLFTFIHNEDS